MLEEISKDELRAKIYVRFLVGILLVVGGGIGLSVLSYLFPRWGGKPQFYSLPLGVAMLIGVAWIIYVNNTWKNHLDHVKLFENINSSKLLLTSAYVATEKNNVYIFSSKRGNLLYFAQLQNLQTAKTSKGKYPSLFWHEDFSKKAKTFNYARRKGKFTIPIPSNKYITGRGVLYITPIENFSFPSDPETFNENLSFFLDQIKKEDISKI